MGHRSRFQPAPQPTASAIPQPTTCPADRIALVGTPPISGQSRREGCNMLISLTFVILQTLRFPLMRTGRPVRYFRPYRESVGDARPRPIDGPRIGHASAGFDRQAQHGRPRTSLKPAKHLIEYDPNSDTEYREGRHGKQNERKIYSGSMGSISFSRATKHSFLLSGSSLAYAPLPEQQ